MFVDSNIIMASLGSGRKERFGSIESLRQSEVLILKTLLEWDYNKQKASSHSISTATQMSVTAADKGLRYLNGRGIAGKSPNGSWRIHPDIKKELIIEIGVQASEQAQSTPAEKNNPDPSHPA